MNLCEGLEAQILWTTSACTWTVVTVRAIFQLIGITCHLVFLICTVMAECTSKYLNTEFLFIHRLLLCLSVPFCGKKNDTEAKKGKEKTAWFDKNNFFLQWQREQLIIWTLSQILLVLGQSDPDRGRPHTSYLISALVPNLPCCRRLKKGCGWYQML